MGGDLNAKSPLWNSLVSDRRGQYWEEWIAALNLVVLNEGHTRTFVRGMSASFIDVTISSQRTARKIGSWRVVEEENLSLHRYIMY